MSPLNGVIPQDNIMFQARIRYAYAQCGRSCAHVVFMDVNPAQPYQYIMTGESMEELFKRLHAGKLVAFPDGFDVRMTFIKKGTQLFAKLI